jgi:hypothetical protein
VAVLLDLLDPAVGVLLLVLLLQLRVVTRGSGGSVWKESTSQTAILTHILDADVDEVLARRVKLVLLGEGVRSKVAHFTYL